MLRKISLSATTPINPAAFSAKCPHCGNQSNFEGAGIPDLKGINFANGDQVLWLLGIRRCPNSQCHGQLFFQKIGSTIEVFPFTRIDFNPSEIPQAIVHCFKEALECEANQCYIASAIMVRKTLEMICEDRQAAGSRLVDRLSTLQTQITLPPQLFKAMDNLRILGNDAAHVELKDFDKIGKDELEVAIDLTKEILKGIYQMDSIVDRLEKLKKAQAA
ncbi:MAG TPA: DUF4145 domain-containing protein [Candidatus Acidoferrum sp.]|nr:DUF4145 domain-containing protein [Candidatus Acidoferrum sp.]